MSYLTKFYYPPTYQDAFGRLRVSEPFTLLDSDFLTDRATYEWAELTTGGGAIAYTTNFPQVVVTSTGAASKAVRQSRRYAPYQPGKSYLVLATGILEMSGGVPGSTARIGLFDDGADKTVGVTPGNGFFFQLSGTALSVVQRSGVTGVQVDTVVPQAAWNIDPLDGTGPSGVTIVPGRRQIFFIEMEWLGVGTVMMGIMVNRQFTPCHAFQHENLPGATAYTNRGTLPVRYELASDGTGAAAELRQICATVISEGGFSGASPRTKRISVNRGNTPRNVFGTTETPLLAVRLQAGRNRAVLTPVRYNAMTTTGGDMLISLYRFISPEAYGAGPLTGAAWGPAVVNAVATFTNISVAEVDRSATAVDVTGATYPLIRISSFYFSNESDAGTLDLSGISQALSADIQGRSDWLVITARRALTTGGNEDLFASLTWDETE